MPRGHGTVLAGRVSGSRRAVGLHRGQVGRDTAERTCRPRPATATDGTASPTVRSSQICFGLNPRETAMRKTDRDGRKDVLRQRSKMRGHSGNQIKSKLQAYLTQLYSAAHTRRESTSEEDDPDGEEENADDEGDAASMLGKTYYGMWQGGAKAVCLGDYITLRDIPALVKLLFDNALGTWAHERIVCVGHRAGTLPPPGYESEGKPLYGLNVVRLSLSDLAKMFLVDLKRRSPNKAKVFELEYRKRFERSFPSKQRHVLFNFDSGEYVLGERGLFGRDLYEYRDMTAFGLGDAAMSRICWSTDTSTSIYSGEHLARGPWAGHRFAIVSEPAFDDFTDGREGWTDVTDRVSEELGRIWGAKTYGSGG